MKLFIEIHTPADKLSIRALEDLLNTLVKNLHAECSFIQEGPPDVRAVLVSVAAPDGLTISYVKAELTTLQSPPPGWKPITPVREWPN